MRRLTYSVMTIMVLAGLVQAAPAAAATGGLTLPYRQMDAVVVAGGLVFASDVNGVGDYDLYRAPWGSAPTLVAGGAGNQWQPSASGSLVAYVSRPPVLNDGSPVTSEVRVKDLESGAQVVLSAPGTLNAEPAIHGMTVAWTEVRASGGWGAIVCYDLDADDDGIADFLEPAPPAPASPVEAVGGTTAAQVALGQAGMVWAERAGSDARVLRRVDPFDAGTQSVLRDSAGRTNPQPSTAGVLVVWSESGGIAQYRTDTLAYQLFGLAGENNITPVTDGTNVAWLVGAAADDWRLLVRTASGTGTVLNSAYVLGMPALGEGRVVWTRNRDSLGDDSDIEWTDIGDVAPLVVTPVAGADRYETAIKAARLAFPDGADAVVIATGANWPDALGGAALAGSLEAPILLTGKDALPALVEAEIAALGATKAYILGGTGAVGPAVESRLVQLFGSSKVTRFPGTDRYHTAALIAAEVSRREGSGYEKTVFVATGANFPDALAAAPLAAAGRWPIVLAGPSGLDARTLQTLKDTGVTRAFVLGGTQAVPASVADQIKSTFGVTPTRLWGDTRYTTALRVAKTGVLDPALGLGWDGVAFATGLNYPDALAGGVLQGTTGSVMLLTSGTTVHSEVLATMDEHHDAITEIRFLGGLQVIPQSVRDLIAAVWQ